MGSIMLYAYFLLAFISYAISAALPFLVSKTTQLWIAVGIGIVTNICWTLISRSVSQSDIPIYSLYYDAMLTLTFLVIPFFFITFELTSRQVIGILFVLVGLFLTK